MTVELSLCLERHIEMHLNQMLQDINQGRIPRYNKVIYKRLTQRKLYSLAVHLRVMDIIHGNLSNANPITQRDLFYQDVGLFRIQTVSDYAIERLAKQLNVTREDLNVVIQILI